MKNDVKWVVFVVLSVILGISVYHLYFTDEYQLLNPPPQAEVKVSPPQVQTKVLQDFKDGEVFQEKLKDGGLAPKMVAIPIGRFVMGEGSEKHFETIKRFAVSIYEITFEEYDRFCEATGRSKPSDSGWGRGTRPVINVSWHDAVAYAKWLSEQTGYEYRLLTEAEWEYAARAGSTTSWSFGDNESELEQYAWYDKNSERMTHPVGEKLPNAFGLYDMHGNVWEWKCSDIESYGSGTKQACSENTNESKSVIGGSYDDDSRSSNSTRGPYSMDRGDNDVGFRILRILP